MARAGSKDNLSWFPQYTLMKSSGFCISFTAALPSKLACTISPKQNVRLPWTHTTTFLLRVAVSSKKSDQTILKSLRALYKELGGQKRKIKVEIKKKIGLSPSLSPTLLPFLSLRSDNTKHYMIIGICFCCHFDK